jgi:hypothetical protein
MFKHMKHIAHNLVQAATRKLDALSPAALSPAALSPALASEPVAVAALDPALASEPVTLASESVTLASEPVTLASDPVTVASESVTVALIEPVALGPAPLGPAPLGPAPLGPLTVPFEKSETAVIEKWRAAVHSVDVLRALIGMIQQLCIFSEPDKRCIRTYEVDMDDVKKTIERIRRRPRLMIDTSDIDTRDRVVMSRILHNMRKMIGMFHVRDFMVRVEHAFDNSQISSEYYVMSRLAHADGMDHTNHLVVPIHIQMNSIENVPPWARTPFHHISYSIQPVVAHSQTMDTWHRHARPSRAPVLALCKQMAEALVHLHALNIVHGDIKPGNTLVQGTRLYIIDFGMSGAHNAGEGTGGTKPYCAPETGNGCNRKTRDEAGAWSYHWTQIRIENDMWSFGLMFFTMLALRRCIYHPNEYPVDFFNDDGHINASYFDNISDDSLRELFERTLCPRETRYTAAEFLCAINQLG